MTLRVCSPGRQQGERVMLMNPGDPGITPQAPSETQGWHPVSSTAIVQALDYE